MNATLKLVAGGRAVFRTAAAPEAEAAVESAVLAGYESVLVDYRKGALETVERLVAKFASSVIIGVGEILNSEAAFEAVDAGARFIVAPLPDVAVYKTCNNLSVPVLGEAATANEARVHFQLGAETVVLCPAGALGPEYLSQLLKLGTFAVSGGITAANAAPLIKAGAAFAIADCRGPGCAAVLAAARAAV